MRVITFIWHLLIGWGGLIIGGIYTALVGFKQVLTIVDELILRFYDYAVYEVIDTPRGTRWERYKPSYVQTNFGTIISSDRESGGEELTPYSVQEIAQRLGRKEKRVLRSLKRLKRMYKAVETKAGWYSKDTAPPIKDRL